jgi:hypothetical protein
MSFSTPYTKTHSENAAGIDAIVMISGVMVAP